MASQPGWDTEQFPLLSSYGAASTPVAVVDTDEFLDPSANGTNQQANPHPL